MSTNKKVIVEVCTPFLIAQSENQKHHTKGNILLSNQIPESYFDNGMF